MLLKLFHLSVVVLNVYTIWYDQMYVKLPFPSKDFEELPFSARHIFLTMWCLLLQTLYFGISFINDIYGSNEISPRRPPLIRRIKDLVFSLAFPIAIYVSMAFWALNFLSKDLVWPPDAEPLFPMWVNHSMHTAILPFIFIELFVTKRNYPSRRLGISVLMIFISAYILWMHVLHFTTGAWVYPFLDLLNGPIRIIFCALSACLGLGIYFFGECINYFVSRTFKSNIKSMKDHLN